MAMCDSAMMRIKRPVKKRSKYDIKEYAREAARIFSKQKVSQK